MTHTLYAHMNKIKIKKKKKRRTRLQGPRKEQEASGDLYQSGV
jgi:hypothetical protein